MLRFALLVSLVGSFYLAPPVSAQDALPALGYRDGALVASTPHFRFHSDFWLNLHDYLHGLFGGGPGDERLEAEETACFDALPAAQAQAWTDVVAFYEAEMAERHHRRDPVIRALRYQMANLAPTYDPQPDVEEVLVLLRRAAPAYQACLWAIHDTRNRERIGGLVDRAVRYGPALTDTLGRLYQSGWPEDVTVDVSSYASYAGANTASGRFDAPHMMISNLEPDLDGWSGLELLYHEASHLVFGSRHGTVATVLRAAVDSLETEMPRSLWHALSFHTSGWAVQQLAAAAGEAYEPYWLRHNVFSEYHEAIAEHWQPYLDGEATMDEAAVNLVRALTAN